MNYLLKCLSISLLLLAANSVFAQDQTTPVIFERDDIRIEPAPIGGKNGEIVLQRQPVAYNVETRSEEALQLEYVHTLNMLSDTTGVMVMFNAPSVAPLPAWQVFTPVDALFVAENGEILQILPNVTLGQMTQDIMAKDPVKAFLFLRAGQVQAHNLRPHDTVVGDMFIPSPAVMH